MKETLPDSVREKLAELPSPELKALVMMGLDQSIKEFYEGQRKGKTKAALAFAEADLVSSIGGVSEFFRFESDAAKEDWRKKYDEIVKNRPWRSDSADSEARFWLACDWAKQELVATGLDLEKIPTVVCSICRAELDANDREAMARHKESHAKESKGEKVGAWLVGEGRQELPPEEVKYPLTPQAIVYAGVIRLSRKLEKSTVSGPERDRWFEDKAEVIGRGVVAFSSAWREKHVAAK